MQKIGPRRTIAAGGLLVAALSLGCTMALEHPPMVVPGEPLKRAVGSAVIPRAAVVALAAVGAESRVGGFKVQFEESALAAAQLHAVVIEELEARQQKVRYPSRVPPPGFFDSQTRFEQVGVNPYGGDGAWGGYLGRVTIPAFFCADDSLLRAPPAQQALRNVLATLATVRKSGDRPDPVPDAGALRDALHEDAVVIAVVRIDGISVVRKTGQAIVSAALTFGMIPAFEPSSCVMHAYLLDLRRGELRWANACRINQVDSLALDRARSELFRRWPS